MATGELPGTQALPGYADGGDLHDDARPDQEARVGRRHPVLDGPGQPRAGAGLGVRGGPARARGVTPA
jgi:hypothetical protein